MMKISQIQWGDDSAEKDPYLLDYFFTSTAFSRLRDKSKSIVIGRKGSGKSALRKKLEVEFSGEPETYVINIAPKYNSIKSVLNEKDIAASFGEELFFQYTWLRHVLLDCLCRVGDQAKGDYAGQSVGFAREVASQLNRTSKDFVENITDVLSKIKARAGKLGDLGIHIERELKDVADTDSLLHHFLKIAEGGAQFVILVDDLDLGWDNSIVANNMMLGLLQATAVISSQSHNVFTCVFFREDVYSLLITSTQHSDKYRNVERIRWDRESLLSILSRRINYNRSRHALPSLGDEAFRSVFPDSVGSSNTDNWLLERTLMRPRELIQFARFYTESLSADEPSAEALKECESSYSSWKLDDLCAEYKYQYPGLNAFFDAWKRLFFRRKYHLQRAEVEEMLLNLATTVDINETWWTDIVHDTDIEKLLKILYEIGFIGDFVLGGEGGSKTFYSYADRHEPRFEEIQIHPCFRRSVNTVERIRRQESD